MTTNPYQEQVAKDLLQADAVLPLVNRLVPFATPHGNEHAYMVGCQVSDVEMWVSGPHITETEYVGIVNRELHEALMALPPVAQVRVLTELMENLTRTYDSPNTLFLDWELNTMGDEWVVDESHPESRTVGYPFDDYNSGWVWSVSVTHPVKPFPKSDFEKNPEHDSHQLA